MRAHGVTVNTSISAASIRPEFIAVYESLVDAMRADVAPEAERLPGA
jgi:hypothetical protein